MTKQSHDHNFKNLFLAFPKETLELLFPQAEQKWGQVRNNINNPAVKILLPKMNYKKDERIEVIRQAYSGLFQLVSR